MIIECQDCGDPIGPEDVLMLETELGCALPEAYKAFLLKYNGGILRPQAAYPARHFDMFYGIEGLFGLDADDLDLRRFLDSTRDDLHPALIPIAPAPCGDLYCMRVRGEPHGAIYMWNHEGYPRESIKNVHRIAPNFETFIGTVIRDPDYPIQGYSSEICRAIAAHDDEAFEHQLSSCADINKPHDEGQTMLIVAIWNYNLHAVRVLLERGADFYRRADDEMDAVLYAIVVDSLDSMRILLRHGADVNARDAEGRPMLFNAVERYGPPMTRLLIRHGADVNTRNAHGQNVFQACADTLETALRLRDFLVNAGARE